MSVVAVAIVLSFHLKHEPSTLELRMARPLGIIFWALSITALLVGVGNYISPLSHQGFSATAEVPLLPRGIRNGQQVFETGGSRADGMEDAIGEYRRLVMIPVPC